MGLRCQLTSELSVSYGVVKGVDLEITESEILKEFTCSGFEIRAAKRLRRLTDEGEWKESEAVRLCINGSSLPPYIYGYGCRLKLDPYEFPVTQCAKCWKFGHYSRFCPSKKVVCPKCTENHENCETVHYTCANCKGDHMALNKGSCPTFHKEKEIRNIMCRENCNYRNALRIYNMTQQKQDQKACEPELPNSNVRSLTANSEIIMTKAQIHAIAQEDEGSEGENMEIQERVQTKDTMDEDKNVNKTYQRQDMTKKSKKRIRQEEIIAKETRQNDREKVKSIQSEDQHVTKKLSSSNDKKGDSGFKVFLKKMKDIITMDVGFEEKISSVCKLVITEVKDILLRAFTNCEWVNVFLKLFVNNG